MMESLGGNEPLIRTFKLLLRVPVAPLSVQRRRDWNIVAGSIQYVFELLIHDYNTQDIKAPRPTWRWLTLIKDIIGWKLFLCCVYFVLFIHWGGGQSNVFTRVCHSVYRGEGVSLWTETPQFQHLVAATAAVGTHPTGMHSCFFYY